MLDVSTGGQPGTAHVHGYDGTSAASAP
jgi:hypothetical protein